MMHLNNFSTFGNSGLVVSPLALGTMTFGTQRWGADQSQSHAIFKRYYEFGGNFIDTADVYSSGNSEKIVGKFIQDMKIRDEIVIATKAGFGTATYPNSGGNGAKHIYQAVNASLSRLGTDYIDLYWLHMWDMITPVEEVLQTMSALMLAGKIRYWGISNAPAWYAAKAVTQARASNLPAPIALQLEYSLVERNIEQEHIPFAQNDGLAIQPWSPLAGGFLTGKYSESDPNNVAGKRGATLPDGATDEGKDTVRLAGDNPFGDSKFTPRNWKILNTINQIAKNTEYQPAQIALNWLIKRKGVASPLIGASNIDQLQSNLNSLTITLDEENSALLDKISEPDLAYPSALFNSHVQKFVFGGSNVKAW